MPRIACRHPYHIKDPLLNEILPRLPGNCLNYFSRHGIEDVVVCIGAAETRGEGNVTKASCYLLTIIGRRGPPKEVTCSKSESAPVNKQVTNRQLICNVRI